jgi:hypothetical protein
MSDASAIGAAFLGSLAVLFVLISGEYYPSMMGPGQRKLPKWWGRLWFLGFAAIMFYLALHHFFGKK